MKNITYAGNQLLLDGGSILTEFPIQDAVDLDQRVVVLLDPDSYLSDTAYSTDRRRGNNPVRNLLAYSRSGELLWEADFPEQADYYYRLVSSVPLVALSFSSYECEIDPQTGRIISRKFLK
jgi:hypothetical protein